MTLPRLALLLAALVAVVAPAAAQADRVKVSTEEPDTGVYLAGNQAVYLDYDGQQNRIRLARPGVAPDTLLLFASSSSDDDCCATVRSVGLDASPTRLATLFSELQTAKGVIVNNRTKLEAGPLAGPLGPLYECTTGGEYEAGGVDLDGDRIAFVAGGCNNAGRSVVVRDLATGGEVTSFPAPAGKALWDVQLAGPYLAYSTSANQFRPDEPRDITVREIASGTEPFTVSGAGPFDLQADGKLAVANVATGTDCKVTIDWYSPAEPARHATGICAASEPHIGGDRILVERRGATGDAVDVVLSDLNGNARTLAGAASIGGLGGVDFDGTRAAYVVRSCVPLKADIYLDDLSPSEAAIAVPGSCPIKPLQRRVRASRTGKVALSFSCPRGCGGSVELVRGEDDLLSTSPDFAGGPGRARATVKLTRATRRLLARRGRLRVSVEGVVKTLDTDGSRPFVRNVTLLAPKRSR